MTENGNCLTKGGTNGAGWQFWKVLIPEELATGGLEVSLNTDKDGLNVGGGVITWDELDEARKALT